VARGQVAQNDPVLDIAPRPWSSSTNRLLHRPDAAVADVTSTLTRGRPLAGDEPPDAGPAHPQPLPTPTPSARSHAIVASSRGLPLIAGQARAGLSASLHPPRHDARRMALTAARSALNLVLMLLAVVGLRIAVELGPRPRRLLIVQEARRRRGQHRRHLLLILAFMNAGLCIFNLIPIPPLDAAASSPRSSSPTSHRSRPCPYFLLMPSSSSRRIIRVPIAYLLIGAF